MIYVKELKEAFISRIIRISPLSWSSSNKFYPCLSFSTTYSSERVLDNGNDMR